MDEVGQLTPGDRVRVDPGYWNTDVAGRIGTVSTYPEGVTPQEGAVWVEFDLGDSPEPGFVDGAEVDLDRLRRL